jgi:hypothetical protein
VLPVILKAILKVFVVGGAVSSIGAFWVDKAGKENVAFTPYNYSRLL